MEQSPSLSYLSDRFPWEEPSYVGSFKFLWVASVPLGYLPAEESTSSSTSSLWARTMASFPEQTDNASKKILDWIDSLFSSVTGAVMLMEGDICTNNDLQAQIVHRATTLLVTKSELQATVSHFLPVCTLPDSFPSELPFLPFDTYFSDLRSTNFFTDDIEPVTTARPMCMWGRRLERVPKLRLPGQAQAIYCFDSKKAVQSSKYIAKAEAQQAFHTRDRGLSTLNADPSWKSHLAPTSSKNLPTKHCGSGFSEDEGSLWTNSTSRAPLKSLTNSHSTWTTQGSEILHRRPGQSDVNNKYRRPRNGAHQIWSY